MNQRVSIFRAAEVERRRSGKLAVLEVAFSGRMMAKDTWVQQESAAPFAVASISPDVLLAPVNTGVMLHWR